MKLQIPKPKNPKGNHQPSKNLISPLSPPPFESLEPKIPRSSSRPSSLSSPPEVEDQKKKLEEMKKTDRKRSRQLAAKILKDLEEEIKKWRRIREEHLKNRRQSLQEQQKGKGEKPKESPPPLQEPSTKPKRGFFGLARRQGFWGRRIKSAQQQSQPEKVGRRIGG